MKKRVLAVALLLCLGCLLLTGCGEKKAEPANAKPSQEQENEVQINLADYLPKEVKNYQNTIVMNPEIKFGMSQVKVKELDGRRASKDYPDSLEYDPPGSENYNFRYHEAGIRKYSNAESEAKYNYEYGKMGYDSRFEYYYYFDGRQANANHLVKYICKVHLILSSETDYYLHYLDIKDILTQAYGECSFENYTWYDDTDRDNKDRWNDAFADGDFGILTTWTLPEFTITVVWDVGNELSIEYKAIPGTY